MIFIDIGETSKTYSCCKSDTKEDRPEFLERIIMPIILRTLTLQKEVIDLFENGTKYTHL